MNDSDSDIKFLNQCQTKVPTDAHTQPETTIKTQEHSIMSREKSFTRN